MTTETLNAQPSMIAVTPAVAEPGPASPPTEKPRRSRKPNDDPSRCHYRYPNGRRCTLPGLPAKSGLCLRHYHRQVAAGLPLTPLPNDFEDLSDDLLPEVTGFSSSEDLRNFLTRLLFLMTEGRISPRRASVLAYVTIQLLHTHIAVEKELDDEPQQIILDLPRPKRDPIEDPERASYKSMAKYGTPVASETGIHSGPGASPGGLSTSGSTGPSTEKSK